MLSLAILGMDYLGKPLWAWLLFGSLVALLLAFDLGVLHRKAREIQVRESLLLSAAYVGIAIAFGAWVWTAMGRESGAAYLTGFFIEKTLALDNVFVISLIFSMLAIPAHLQHRVLFYGILGVIAMRAAMIAFGTALISQFAWLLLVFGVILIATGIKILVVSENPSSWVDNRLMRFLQRRLRVTKALHGEAFVVRLPDRTGGAPLLHATPLLVALIMIEFADLVFAIDSLPAIWAITTDPYIVYTSNIFAILGLRALYFALAASVHRFHHLKKALSLVLIFIGFKIFWNQMFGKFDPLISLGVTAALLIGGVLFSIWKSRTDEVVLGAGHRPDSPQPPAAPAANASANP
jgi:tellurite resistance protein TerC